MLMLKVLHSVHRDLNLVLRLSMENYNSVSIHVMISWRGMQVTWDARTACFKIYLKM